MMRSVLGNCSSPYHAVSKDAYRLKFKSVSFKDLDLLCDFEMAGRYDKSRNDIRSESQFKCLH